MHQPVWAFVANIIWSADFKSGKAVVLEICLMPIEVWSHLFLGLVFCFSHDWGLRFTHTPMHQGNGLGTTRRGIWLGRACSPFIFSKGNILL